MGRWARNIGKPLENKWGDKSEKIIRDFYSANNLELTDELLEESKEYYKGDYKRMISDMMDSVDQEFTDEVWFDVQARYGIKDSQGRVGPELPEDVSEFNSILDEIENETENVRSVSVQDPELKSTVGVNLDLLESKRRATEELNLKREQALESFDFKPVSLQEVVNTVGKGKDDIDEVAQSTKLYLEKYTGRMFESANLAKEKLSPELQATAETIEAHGLDNIIIATEESEDGGAIMRVGDLQSGEELSFSIQPEEIPIFNEWMKRALNYKNQRDINNKSVHKKNELRQDLNAAARDAKDNDRSVREAILRVYAEYGIETDFTRELARAGDDSDYDTVVTTSIWNTKERVVNSINSTLRGLHEVLRDNFFEDNTTYDGYFLHALEDHLNSEIDEDARKLMYGTPKSKYDSDLREERVDVDGTTIIVDKEGDVTGIRKSNGNLSWNYTEDEIKSVRKYLDNREEYSTESYMGVNFPSVVGKSFQVMSDMVPIIGTSALSGGSMGGTMMGTYFVTYGQFYDKEFERTGDVGRATRFATSAALATGFLERTGGIEQAIAKGASRKAISDAIDATAHEMASKGVINGRSFTKTLFDNMRKMGVGETRVEWSQAGAEAVLDAVFNHEPTISVKEIEELTILTPIATMPFAGFMTLTSYGKQMSRDLELAAMRKDKFNELVDQWVENSPNDEIRTQREKEAVGKKAIVEELAKAFEDIDDLSITNNDSKEAITNAAKKIAHKKIEIENARNDGAKSALTSELSDLETYYSELLNIHKRSKESVAKRIEQIEKERSERKERIAQKEAERKKEYRRQRGIEPDGDPVPMEGRVQRVEDFDEMFDETSEGTIEIESEEGSQEFSMKQTKLPDGDVTETATAIYDSEGNVIAQYGTFTETAVEGSVEMSADVSEGHRGKGITKTVYKDMANKTGKPILPGSVTRDAGSKDSSFSEDAANFWESMEASGDATLVEVTTKDGKVRRSLAVLPDGFTSTETIKKIEDTGVEETNIESEAFEQEQEVVTDFDTGEIKLNRNGKENTYTFESFNKNKDGEIVSVNVKTPEGQTRVIRSPEIVAQIKQDKLIYDEKLTEPGNEPTVQEFETAVADSGATTDGRVSTDRTVQDTEATRKEQEFSEGTREGIVGERVNYQGVEGKLIQDADGIYHVVTPDGDAILVEGGQSQSTNQELGITPGKTNLQVAEEQIQEKKDRRSAVRSRLKELWEEIDTKLPEDAQGKFVEEINNTGGQNPVLIASAMAKAFGNKVSAKIREAVGEETMKEAEALVKELNDLNSQLSNKAMQQQKKKARVEDAKKEAKIIKAERKAKEKALRDRVEPKTTKKQPKAPKKKSGVVKETTPVRKRGEVSDEVFGKFREDGTVPQDVIEDIANHFENGTLDKLNDRQREILQKNSSEITAELRKREMAGKYKRKPASKVAEDTLKQVDNSRSRLSEILTNLGFNPEQIASTIVIFDKVARRWAKKNGKSVEDFYTEVLADVVVKDLGTKKAALRRVDGKYIMELTTRSDISSPVHELAHIFQNFLTPEETQQVLDWARHDKWTRDTSELFARGFELFLQGDHHLSNIDAFNNFKYWLLDLYDGIMYYADAIVPTMNTEMKSLYTSLLSSQLDNVTTKKATEANVRAKETFWDRLKKSGVKFKKATFEDILAKVTMKGGLFRRVFYQNTTLSEIASLAVNNGYTEANKAHDLAREQIEIIENEGEITLTTSQWVGMSYALLKIEEGLKDLEARLKRHPSDPDLRNLHDELTERAMDIAQVLSFKRSIDGLNLGIGSHFFQAAMFSEATMMEQAKKATGQKRLSAHDARTIRDISRKLRANEKIKEELADKNAILTTEQMRNIAETMLATGLVDTPIFQKILKEQAGKSQPRKTKDLSDRVSKIRNIINQDPDVLYQEDVEPNLSAENQFMKELRYVIGTLISMDPTIDSFEKLHQELESFLPEISQEKLLDVLVWTDPRYQKTLESEIATNAQIIRREGRLLDELRTYLTESFEAKLKNPKKKYPLRLKEFEGFLTQIQHLALIDHNITSEELLEASQKLEQLQTLYSELMLESVDFGDINLESLIDRVREYEIARKMDSAKKRLSELETITQQLRDGTFEGDLNKVAPRINKKYVDERLEMLARKVGLEKEVIRSMRDLGRKEEILKRISNLITNIDGGKHIQDFDLLLDKVRESIPDVTARELFEALVHKRDPKKVNELLKTARKNIQKELKAIEKLDKFFESESKVKKVTSTPSKIKRLQDMVDAISDLAAVRKDLSDIQARELQGEFQEVVDMYSQYMNNVPGMSLEQVIDQVRAIKDNLQMDKLVDNLVKSEAKIAESELLTYENNIFKVLPEILPKHVTNEIESLRTGVSDNIRIAKLTRVNHALKLFKDKIKDGSISQKEYQLLEEFLRKDKQVTSVNSSLVRLQRENYALRNAFNELIDNKRNKNVSTIIKEFVNTPRLMVLAADLSFVIYQGGVVLPSRPKVAANAFVQMAKVAFNHRKWLDQQADLSNKPFYDLAIQAGVRLVDPNALSLEEELQLKSLLERIPGVGVGPRHIRRFSERIYTSYMNQLRYGFFVDMLKAHFAVNGNLNLNAEDIRNHFEIISGYANHVNTHTGATTVFFGKESFDKHMNDVVNATSGLFIAPRLYASVFRSTFDATTIADNYQLISKRKKLTDQQKKFYKVRRMSNLRIAAGLLAWHGIGLMFAWKNADDEDELREETFNPYSSNFLKTKSGQRVYSISPYVSYYRFVARMVAQDLIAGGAIPQDYFKRSRNMEQKTGFWDHSSDFLRYRLNPFIPSVYDGFIKNRTWNNRPVTDKALFSRDEWAESLYDRSKYMLRSGMLPIWGQGVWDNIERGTGDQIPHEFLLDFMGINAYTVEPFYDRKVQRYLDKVGFTRMDYSNIPDSKKDKAEIIKADVKFELGEWVRNELNKGETPNAYKIERKMHELAKDISKKY